MSHPESLRVLCSMDHVRLRPKKTRVGAGGEPAGSHRTPTYRRYQVKCQYPTRTGRLDPGTAVIPLRLLVQGRGTMDRFVALVELGHPGGTRNWYGRIRAPVPLTSQILNSRHVKHMWLIPFLGLHRDDLSQGVSEFDQETRKRLWILLFTWDWYVGKRLVSG